MKKCGEKIKSARLSRGLSLDEVSRAVKIPLSYLEAIEGGCFSAIAGMAYRKRLVKIYAEYLNLDSAECWHLAETAIRAQRRKTDRIGRSPFLDWPRFIKHSILGLIILSVMIFLGLRVYGIFAPPVLEIIEPRDGIITNDRQIRVVGRSQKEVEISINNRGIYVDADGAFYADLDLQKGMNLIKIIARKRYGREREMNLRILYSGEENKIN